jgi:uncharacterized membrane-anchored protein YitT (DUF2179 family)
LSAAPGAEGARSATPVPGTAPHSWWEDAQALFTASLFISLGYGLLKQAHLLSGGTAGVALLLTRLTPFSFGQLFVALNLPFFWLAVRQMGWAFTLKTFIAIGAVSLGADRLHLVMAFDRVEPLYAAIMGGSCIGIGLLILFRHQACLGGLNVLAIWLQDRRGVRAGAFQLVVDSLVVVASLFVVPPTTILLSVVGSAALNMVLVVNHRPGRYLGT